MVEFVRPRWAAFVDDRACLAFAAAVVVVVVAVVAIAAVVVVAVPRVLWRRERR